jgi:hypothetical protein
MNPAKAAPSAPVKQADDQQDTGHADEHHGQGGHPGRKMKYRGIRTLDLSDANRTLSHADLKEAPKGQNISLRKRQKI